MIITMPDSPDQIDVAIADIVRSTKRGKRLWFIWFYGLREDHVLRWPTLVNSIAIEIEDLCAAAADRLEYERDIYAYHGVRRSDFL